MLLHVKYVEATFVFDGYRDRQLEDKLEHLLMIWDQLIKVMVTSSVLLTYTTQSILAGVVIRHKTLAHCIG